MEAFLKKIRSKPERTRQMIAFSVSAVIVLVIGVIWAITMATTGGFNFANNSSLTASSSPFSQFGDTVQQAGAQFNSIKTSGVTGSN